MALISNKNVFRNYEILETYEAGIVLTGTEVKSISHSQASINESYITFKKNEAYILNMYVAPFKEGNQFNVDTDRLRKLLLHKKEIIKLQFKSQKEGLTIVPIKIYWKNNNIKLEIGLGKGKKLFDKREDIKKRDLKRESLKY